MPSDYEQGLARAIKDSGKSGLIQYAKENPFSTIGRAVIKSGQDARAWDQLQVQKVAEKMDPAAQLDRMIGDLAGIEPVKKSLGEEKADQPAAVDPGDLLMGQPGAGGQPGQLGASGRGSQSAGYRVQPGVKFSSGPSLRPLRDLGDKIEASREMRLGSIDTAAKGLEESMGAERAAIHQAQQTGEALAVEKAAMIKQTREEMAEDDRQRREKEGRRQELVNDQITRIKALDQELAESSIDPERFYKNEDGSTNYGKKIGAAIAVGLGAAGAALVGGANTAMQIIDNAIARDIDAQKQAIANTKTRGQMGHMELAAVRETLGDERQAEAVTRMRKLERVKLRVQEFSASAEGKKAKSASNQLMAQLDQRLVAAKNQITQQALDAADRNLAMEGQNAKAEIAFGMQKAQMWNQKQASMLSAYAKSTSGGKALPQGAVAKAAGFQTAFNIVDKLEKKWREKMKGNPATIAKAAPWTTESDKWDDLRQAAAAILGKEIEGRMTDEDFQRFLKMLPSSTDWNERAVSKFENLRQVLQAKMGGTIQTYGSQGYDVTGLIRESDPNRGIETRPSE